MKKIALLLLFTAFSNLAKAQTEGLGSWNILNVKYNFNKKWSVFVEGQIRSLKFYDNFHYHEIKGGINYRIHPNVQLTIAAGDYDTYKEGGTFIKPKNNDEFRLWNQVQFNHSVNKLKLEQRYRAEMRWTVKGYRNRFRYRTGLSYPLGKPKDNLQKWMIGANNELFFTDKAPYFERNRSSIFVNYRQSKTTSFQLGYLNQFDYKINDETGRDFLQIGVYFDLN